MTNREKTPKKLMTWLIMFAMMFAFGMPMQLAHAQSNVSDIAGHWANKKISNWIDKGIVKGYPDGTFKPNNSITRAEFAVLVNKSFQFKDVIAIEFKDVQANDWFYEEIAKAKKAGYMGGYEDGTIKPNAPISRQEVATIVAKLKGLYENNGAADQFIDAAKIPTWSKGFIGAVVGAGYMGGYPDKSFQPVKNISRAEAIVVLNNILGNGEIHNEKNKVKMENIGNETVKVNKTIEITVKTDPEDAKITITNSDDKVIKTTLNDKKIEIKGLKEGKATVTVTAKKGGLESAEITFKVDVSRSSSSGGGGGGGGSTKPSKPALHEAIDKYGALEEELTKMWIVNVNIKDTYKEQVESVRVQGETANKISENQWRVIFEDEPELTDDDIEVSIINPIEKVKACLGLFEDTTVKVWTKEGITITKVTANGKEAPLDIESDKPYTIKLMGLKEGETVKVVVTTPIGEFTKEVTIEKL